jgi:hypothetical protein
VTEPASLAGLTSNKGWPKVDYDQTIWIPCPPSFGESMTAREWARGFAGLWWDASGLKHGKRQVKGLETALLEEQQSIYRLLPCHTALLHLPDVTLAPLPVCLAVWQAAGDRDRQLRELVRADEPAAVEAPLVEPVKTEKLGTGLRCLYYQRASEGTGVIGVLSYAWRSDELETDLRVFTACPDLGRLERARPDIDTLIQAITILPVQ